MKKILNKFCYIIIFLVGIIDIIYGFHYQIKQYRFKENAGIAVASIYQTTNREDHKQVLYINFLVENKKYEGVLILKNKKNFKSTIKIYYDKKNPLNFTSGEIDKFGVFFIIFGIILVLIVMIFLLQKTLEKRKMLK